MKIRNMSVQKYFKASDFELTIGRSLQAVADSGFGAWGEGATRISGGRRATKKTPFIGP